MWQHVKLSVQIRPWDTLACCWDIKQATNQNHVRNDNIMFHQCHVCHKNIPLHQCHNIISLHQGLLCHNILLHKYYMCHNNTVPDLCRVCHLVPHWCHVSHQHPTTPVSHSSRQLSTSVLHVSLRYSTTPMSHASQ